MSSPKKGSSPSEQEISFDTYEIDYKIFKDKEFIQKCESKSNPKSSQLNKFKLIPGLTQELIQKKDENSNYPKYFSAISTDNFDYIGILSNQLKRDKYGFSKMDNEDEFLGEYNNDSRDGFGIYKYNYIKNDEGIQEMYIGEYKNNKKDGKGMYLKISKDIKENFSSSFGIFEDDVFKRGKIFSSKDGIDMLYIGKLNEIGMLYIGKLNEIGEPEDDDAIIFEEGNKIFRGKISKGDMIEGRNIFINEKYEKIKAYYFRKIEGKYDFDYTTKEEIDEECIKKLKENPVKNFGKQIKNIFDEINNAFDKFKDYDTAIKIDFEKDIKNKIQNEIENLIK